jgi:cytochrome c peroxidase
MSKEDIAALRKAALEVIQPIPDKMPGSENDTKALISLGEKLYFEKNLSMNKSQSCNSCHMVDKGRGGVDNEPTSPGAFGKRGGRNSPTTLNAGFQFAQFWDGRAATLEDQAKGPVLNPIEMAMPSADVVIERLSADKAYVKMFKSAFPKDASPINYDNYSKAVGAFERTLITRDRFDDFLKGSDKALSAAELTGLKTFLDTGCTTCHNGAVIGGNSFMKLGLVNAYPSEDKGREEVTKDADDRHKFKVPMLRNIAITGPYFHDGSIKSLNEAVEKMAWHQLGQKLEKDKVDSIVAFLGSLTDKKRKAPSTGAE